MKTIARILPAACVLWVLSGCEGESAPEPPTVDVTGTWSGTWQSASGPSGSLSATLTQSGPDVDGTITLTGSPCFSAGNISGTVSGNTIETGALFTGDLRVDFSGTVVGDQMSGSYDTIEGGYCTGDRGTWSANR